MKFPHYAKGALLSIGIALGGVVAFGVDAQEQGPSFSCAKASSADEIAICSNPRLAEMDQVLAKAFSTIRAAGKPYEKELVLDTARFQLAVRKACGSNTYCILSRQVDNLEAYSSYARRSTPPKPSFAVPNSVKGYRSELRADAIRRGLPLHEVPEKVGECSETIIAAFTGRLSDKPDDSGVRVYFGNGESQVSYELEPPITRSRVGDKVRMCLNSLPQDCPPGDDRGRDYKTTNLRTQESWILSPDQHMCGGA
jgi:uncharacterized protein